jgi:hypothetical protein
LISKKIKLITPFKKNQKELNTDEERDGLMSKRRQKMSIGKILIKMTYT